MCVHLDLKVIVPFLMLSDLYFSQDYSKVGVLWLKQFDAGRLPESWVLAPTSICGICRGHNGAVTNFFPSTWALNFRTQSRVPGAH